MPQTNEDAMLARTFRAAVMLIVLGSPRVVGQQATFPPGEQCIRFLIREARQGPVDVGELFKKISI